MKKVFVMVVSIMFVLVVCAATSVYAGNPAPLFSEPVHLGGGNPHYGKTKKKPVVAEEQKQEVQEQDLEPEQTAPQEVAAQETQPVVAEEAQPETAPVVQPKTAALDTVTKSDQGSAGKNEVAPVVAPAVEPAPTTVPVENTAPVGTDEKKEEFNF